MNRLGAAIALVAVLFTAVSPWVLGFALLVSFRTELQELASSVRQVSLPELTVPEAALTAATVTASVALIAAWVVKGREIANARSDVSAEVALNFQQEADRFIRAIRQDTYAQEQFQKKADGTIVLSPDAAESWHAFRSAEARLGMFSASWVLRLQGDRVVTALNDLLQEPAEVELQERAGVASQAFLRDARLTVILSRYAWPIRSAYYLFAHTVLLLQKAGGYWREVIDDFGHRPPTLRESEPD